MFFTKDKGPRVHDVMYMDEQACAKAVAQWLQQHTEGKAGMWFQQDMERFRQLLGTDSDRVVLASRLSYSQAAADNILFIGHYPLRSVETALYEELGIKTATVYMHLDMPVMQLFGSARIKELIIKMGMQQDEAIEHNMITAAIKNALDKIASKVTVDMPARSEAEWITFYGN